MKVVNDISILASCSAGMSGPPYIPEDAHGRTDVVIGNDKITIGAQVTVGTNTEFSASYSNDFHGANNEYQVAWHHEW